MSNQGSDISTTLLGYVINGPLVNRDVRGTLMGALGFLLLAIFTQVTLHYRSKLALVLGEAAVHDLRRDVFAHLQTMTMSFYHRTPVGRVISRRPQISKSSAHRCRSYYLFRWWV